MNGFVKSFCRMAMLLYMMPLHKIRPFYYYIYTEVNEVVFEVTFASSSLLHLLLFKQRKRRIILHPAILVVATLHHQFALQQKGQQL